jgi:hypothetical protein
MEARPKISTVQHLPASMEIGIFRAGRERKEKSYQIIRTSSILATILRD